jgi:aryl-alcohol dehydrogenase-like predicted oxidoreductase
VDELLEGRATAEGTERYAKRFADLPGHFRCPDRLWLASIGLGTRTGDPGGGDDLGYRSAAGRALECGINVFDTALSYRMQLSERTLGAALRRAIGEGRVARDEIYVITKGGYLTIDPELVQTRVEAQRYLHATYVDSGLVDVDTVVNGRHSLEPAFLDDQIERSRRNLGLASLDLYCVQEPELHLAARGPDEFRQVLINVVETLEQAVARGVIASYGFSTWSAFLVPYTERGHLSLSEVFETVLEVGGPDHHMRGIQLPYGVAMGEALGLPSQIGEGAQAAGVLDLLRDTGTAVFAISPLAQGRAVRGLPRFLGDHMPGLTTDAQRALQFARSGPAVTTALVGMRSAEHVDENIGVAAVPALDSEAIVSLFAEARLRP